MDGAEGGDQLLYFDGVFGIAGMVWDVGRDAAFFDFGSGDFRGVGGGFIAPGGGKVGGDETFAVSGGALRGVSAGWRVSAKGKRFNTEYREENRRSQRKKTTYCRFKDHDARPKSRRPLQIQRLAVRGVCVNTHNQEWLCHGLVYVVDGVMKVRVLRRARALGEVCFITLPRVTRSLRSLERSSSSISTTSKARA
jgi:hypothetical protein